MSTKTSVQDFWWFNNSTCWRIQREGFVDHYLYLPTMRYVFKSVFGKWLGTKEINTLGSQTDKQRRKIKHFKNEKQAIKWLCGKNGK